MKPLDPVFGYHPRRWRENLFVYPVISRRSRGLSIGINLNPDGACNFHCVYCSVDRDHPRTVQAVDLARLETELRGIVASYRSLFDEPEFQAVAPKLRRLNDLAFSGDAEPTTSPAFPEAARIAAKIRTEFALSDVKIVLITNASGLARPEVAAALSLLDEHGLEIWAKLDAGSEEHFRRMNRAAMTLEDVLESLLAAARLRPIVVQSLFAGLNGVGPGDREIESYIGRLRWLLAGGGRISRVQVYTVARSTAECGVEPLAIGDLEAVADRVRALGLVAEVFP